MSSSRSRGPAPERFARLPRNLAPLGFRNYALFWSGFAASSTGRAIEQTGAVWLVYTLTESPILLGLVGIAKAVPTFFIGPLGGVIADRVDQRKLLFTTQLLSLLASLILGLLVATGLIQLWHVYLQIALVSVISAFDVSARQALFPRLVPRAQLAEAVTLTAMAARASALIGPMLGGLAIAGLGVAAPFLLNAATFLALMLAVVLIRGVVPRMPSADSSMRGEMAEGVRHIWNAPVLIGVLRMELVFGVLQMNAVMITIVGREILDVGPEGLGALLAAPAVGAIVGILGLLVFGHTRHQGRFVVVCQLAYAGALVALALSGDFLLSFVILAATGLFDTLVSVTRLNIMQLATPGRMRGRVMANMRVVTGGVGPLAQTQSGLLAGVLGAPLALVGAAATLAIAAASTARLNPALWNFSRDETAVPRVDATTTAEVPPT